MAKIKEITAREILNAKGIPTIETSVTLNDGTVGIASVPSGTSIGSYEAAELRDKDPMHFKGMGVQKAIQNILTIIAPKLTNIDADKQQEIDKTMIEMDGTQNKSRLGANAMLSVSMAVTKAAAASSVMPLFLYLRQFTNSQLHMPTPLFNLINGGKHAPDTFDFQEFLVIPASSKTYTDSLQIGTTIDSSLKDLLRNNGLSTLTGDEGGFAPHISTNYDALSLLTQAIDTTNQRLGFDIFLGIDAASSTFYHNNQYHIKDKAQGLSAKSLNDYYKELSTQFHMLYFEDPCSEDDWEGWNDTVTKLSHEAVIVGDDLVATNPYRLQMAIDKKAITAVVIKPNQIGTVLESLAVVEVARAAGLKVVVSHRSGETDDDFIADFAVAIGADYCKFGAPVRGEHVAKYNRLLQIEQQLKLLQVSQS